MNNNITLAKIGERTISQHDLDLLIKNLDPKTREQFNSEAGKAELLNQLINQELIYLDAIDSHLDKEEEFLSELERVSVNVLKQYAVNKLFDQAKVADEEILDFYEKNKQNYMTQKSLKASHILVDSTEKAASIREEIEHGLSFEDAAKKYSKCQSAANGGDLGYFTKGTMVPQFEEAVFNMEINELSEPVETYYGCHLIKLFDVKEPEVRPLEEVREQIYSYLLSSKHSTLYFNKIEELKKKYPVEK